MSFSIPIVGLPNLIVQYIQAQVSFSRINNYLNAQEIDPETVGSDTAGRTVVSLKNATLTWNLAESPTLEDINMDIEKRQLVAVVGQVGSGKSSLLSAMLGDMEKVDNR